MNTTGFTHDMEPDTAPFLSEGGVIISALIHPVFLSKNLVRDLLYLITAP